MADPGPSNSGASQRSPNRLDVDIIRRAALWDRTDVNDATLSLAALATFEAASTDRGFPCEVTLVLTDDSEVQQLNRTWREVDAPTNVLSFSSGEPVGALQVDPRPLGDVVLAGETVVKEAGLKGVSVPDHVSHLVVHGVLHLLGHDHEQDDDAERMEALETRILAGLGISDPYAEAGAVAEVSP